MPKPSPHRTPLRRRVGAVLALAGGLLLLSAGVAGAQVFPPEAVSEEGADIRDLYILVFFLAAVVFIAVEGGIVWLAIKYRRRSDELPPQIHGNRGVEVLWTVIPTVIVVVLFALSYVVLEDVESAPDADRAGGSDRRHWGSSGAWSLQLRQLPLMPSTVGAVSSRDPAETELLQVSDGGAVRAPS